MKKHLLFLLISFVFLYSNKAQAQYVTIPDTNFVAWLNANGFAGCMNGNQMDTTCGAVVSVASVDCSYQNISDLTGIEYFDNLKTLICRSNQLASLPLLPSSLVNLYCYDNQLTTLPTFPNTLSVLYCQENQLTNLPTLPNSLIILYCRNNQLTILPILPSSLKYLDCFSNQLTYLPTLPNSLTDLLCGNNQLTSLPVLPNSLMNLYCFNNQLSNLPTLPNSLTLFVCPGNQLTNLPTLPNSLDDLDCSNNQLTYLPALPNSLTNLRCYSNQLSILPSLPPSLSFLSCENNQLTNLPTLPNSLSDLQCTNNQLTSMTTLPNSLTYLSCNYNLFTSLPVLPDSLWVLNCSNNPNLNCLPKLNTIVNLDFSNTGIQCIPNYGNVTNSNPLLSSLSLCDTANTNGCIPYWNIAGKIYQDTNSNCLAESNEPKIENIKLNLLRNSLIEQTTYSNLDGNYAFDTDTGLFTISVDTINMTFIIVCPLSYMDTAYIAGNDTLRENKNFALECKPGFDVGTTTVVRDSGIFRPANFANIKIFAGDMSNHYGLHCAAGTSGAVQIIITGPATYISTVNGALIPLVNGDTLTYTIADFGLVDFDNDFQIQVQTDTLAQMGNQVCFTVNVTPTQGDINVSNNTLTHCFTVVNSYDPNLKSVYPIERIEDADGKLTYTIQFQNTGNAPAQHIYVMDTLDAALDASTFELLAYSVQPQVQLIGNVLRFNFPNINLPDSTNDEPNSHGYVQFSIKLKDSLPQGTVVSNTSFIYFDFNPPIQTNTVTDTLTDCDNLIANAWFAKTSLCKNDTLFAAMELQYPYSNIKWLVDNVLAATGDSVAISNIGLGTHIIKVVIKTPYCLSKTYFTITLNDLPQPSLGNDTTVCAGLVLDAGGGYSNYFWSNGATSQIVNATNSGAYTVTVTDTNGCMASDVMVATINPNPTINLGNDTSSCNAPVTLNAFGPNLSYLWNTGELTSSIIADTSGLYFVTVTDTNGCATSDSILFINNPLPAAPTISLNGFTFTSSVATGNQWFLNGNLIANAINQTYNATQPGWYSVLVTDTNGCYSWSDSLFVTNTNFNEYALQNGVAATVNGSTHTLTIKGLTQNVVKSIKLIDAMGSVIYANNDLSNKFQIDIPIFNLSKGVYFIQVISKNHNEAIKILLH